MTLFADLSSPLEQLNISVATAAQVRLLCKRDDLLSPAPGTALQGNKVRKLAPAISKALEAKRPPLLVSFGGAYSNHVSALATAGKLFQIPVHLFIRGEEVSNPILGQASSDGATVECITRPEYKLKHDPVWLAAKRQLLASQYGITPQEVWFIPEGGTSPKAIDSVGVVCREIQDALGAPPDYLTLSAGTGGTAAGVILAANAKTRVEVYPALKGEWMKGEIEARLSSVPQANWNCIYDYHFGGYGRFPEEWRISSAGIATRADIDTPGLPPLEAVYTAKMFFGLLDRIRTGKYPPGSTIVALHTGGIY
jgi:1-aminocyclopropane-1-carboxylate deaminase